MGYTYAGVCHPDLPTVKAAFCGAQDHKWTDSSNNIWLQVCTDLSEPLYYGMSRTINASPFTLIYRPWPAFETCEYEPPNSGNPFVLSVADGVALSFLIIGVWLSAATFRWLIGVLSSNRDAD